jgi:hypothetical protein
MATTGIAIGLSRAAERPLIFSSEVPEFAHQEDASPQHPRRLV